MKRGRLGRLDVVLILGLSLLVTGVFSVAYGRTSVGSWSVPITYRGDSLFLLAYLKAAQDGHVRSRCELDGPRAERSVRRQLERPPAHREDGVLCRRASGSCRRSLRRDQPAPAPRPRSRGFVVLRDGAGCSAPRLEWALAGGLTYGLAHYFFWRTLDHLDLVLAWHIPLCVLVGAWAFRVGEWSSGRSDFSCAPRWSS